VLRPKGIDVMAPNNSLADFVISNPLRESQFGHRVTCAKDT
jgi:hypothetical protein